MPYIFRSLRQARRPRVGLALLICGAAVLVAGNVVSASTPFAGSSSTLPLIRGCYAKSSHVLRVLNSPSGRCTTAEVALNWNQQGPAGPRGHHGKRGLQGLQGLQGATGTQGLTGATGPQGAQGLSGPTGATGLVGPQGVQGVAGPAGPAGINWLGAWSQATLYKINDGVSYQGSSWIAIRANSFSAPSTTNTNWSLLAQQGATGAAGSPGLSGLEYDTPAVVTVNGGTSMTATVGCSTTKRILSGGFSSALTTVYASRSYPNPVNNTWNFQIVNTGTTAASVTLYATCANAA